MRKILTSVADFFRKTVKKIKGSPALKYTVIIALCVAILLSSFAVAIFTVSLSVKKVVSDKIISADEASKLENIDYILVLGAGLRSDGSPSDMLSDAPTRVNILSTTPILALRAGT